MSTPRVLAVPAFTDNYLWLIHDGAHAVAVDPGDAAPIRAALAQHGLTLTAILLTHHHADHVGGVTELVAASGVPVYGPWAEDIAGVTQRVGEGDVVELAAPALRLRVLEVPGHTRGHIAYVRDADGAGPPWLFCGDTLFAGGCGRLFEGTPAQMAASLDKLAALPDATRVYCAHEYTVSNLRFAVQADPDNAAVRARLATESARRAQGEATVPSTIGVEKATNPFVRYRDPAIQAGLRAHGRLAADATPVAAFAALREWKNQA
jgi:hydroxyacylglutathione hydrolase